MLVRTNKRIAGFPPPGEVGEVDDEIAGPLVARGTVEEVPDLSTRLGRKRGSTGGGRNPGGDPESHGGSVGSIPAHDSAPSGAVTTFTVHESLGGQPDNGA